MRKLLLALPLLLLWALPASAASCFWVGGTGTWDNATDAAHWASTTGGTASTCAATGGFPKNAGDVANFDANSGGGTVTNNVDLSIGAISLVGWGGTLDFATNNHNVTLTASTVFTDNGAGTHTFNMGSGTWNFFFSALTSSPVSFNAAGLTLSAASATIVFKSTGTCATSNPNVTLGTSHSFGPTTFLQSGSNCTIQIVPTTAVTFNNLTFTGPVAAQFTSAITYTITNGYTWTGTSGNYVNVSSNNVAVATIATPTGSTGTWVVLENLTFTTNTPTFSNCINLGHNTSVTCTAPSGGAASGGVGIIGG